MTGRVITADKFYFNVFLERFGIPTPKVFCFVKDKKPLYFDPHFSIDTSKNSLEQLKIFFSNDMDAFCKPTEGQLGNGAFALKIFEGKIFVDNKETSMDQLIDTILSDDYLVQKRIYQHERMSELCPSAINSIRHREFTWKSNERKQQLGYVAQELKEAIPKSTFEVDQGNGEKRLQINETIIIPYITKAIQEISDELDKLKEENKKLREIVQNLTGGENR